MIKAWRTLEDHVSSGVIRYLGISSLHDANYLKRLYNEAEIKPSILQNRFHSNRQFHVHLQATFRQYNLQIQRFWVLTGNGGGRWNAAMAERKKLTPQQLMLAFVMTLESNTPLVGTHDIQHMKDDLDVAKRHNEIFEGMDQDDLERKEFAKNIGMRCALPTS